MVEEITLDVLQGAGDFDAQIVIDKLRVVSVAYIRQRRHEETDRVSLSVLLEHYDTGWTYNIVYEGADALAYARLINTGNFNTKSLHTRILEKLVADGKIPTGTIGGMPDP